MLKKKILFWILAVVITLAAAVYQRMSGPTHPIDYEFQTSESLVSFELPRSHGGETDCPIDIVVPDQISGNIVFRRFPTNEAWDTLKFERVNDTLIAMLPWQPPAGKLEYHLELFDAGQVIDLHQDENIIIRFKGSVPGWALIPHILLMFFAMLWSNATGLLAAFKIPSYKNHAKVAMILLFAGGMIFGPIVQKYAFGEYWTGWPFGEDLTDNKLLLAVVMWVLAVIFNRKKDRRWLIITAALVLFAIYMIPHSMNGSELDFESGDVVTGMIGLVTIGAARIKLPSRGMLGK